MEERRGMEVLFRQFGAGCVFGSGYVLVLVVFHHVVSH